MKKILITIIILLIYSCNNQNKKNDVSKYKLNGDVKSLTNTHYTAIEKFGEISKGERKREFDSYSDFEYEFNKEGNLSELLGYKPDGTLSYKTKYIYNEEGVLIESKLYGKNWNTKSSYKFDVNGNKTERQNYKLDGGNGIKYIYNYDNKGNRTEDSVYEIDGSIRKKETFKYDEKGNVIEKIRYKTDLSVEYRYVYIYDENNNNVKTSKYKLDGSLDWSSENEYDKYGNEIKDITKDIEGKVLWQYTFRYEYDKDNNWISRVRRRNGSARYMVVREIEYF